MKCRWEMDSSIARSDSHGEGLRQKSIFPTNDRYSQWKSTMGIQCVSHFYVTVILIYFTIRISHHSSVLQILWIRIRSLSSSIAYLRRREWFSHIRTQFLISEGSRDVQGTFGQAIESGKEKWLVTLTIARVRRDISIVHCFLWLYPDVILIGDGLWCGYIYAYGLLIRVLSDKTGSSFHWVTFSQQIRCVDRPLLRKGLQWLLFDLGAFLLWYDTLDHSLHCRFILSSPRYDQWNGVKGTKYLDSIPRLERHWSERGKCMEWIDWLSILVELWVVNTIGGEAWESLSLKMFFYSRKK